MIESHADHQSHQVPRAAKELALLIWASEIFGFRATPPCIFAYIAGLCVPCVPRRVRLLEVRPQGSRIFSMLHNCLSSSLTLFSLLTSTVHCPLLSAPASLTAAIVDPICLFLISSTSCHFWLTSSGKDDFSDNPVNESMVGIQNPLCLISGASDLLPICLSSLALREAFFFLLKLVMLYPCPLLGHQSLQKLEILEGWCLVD